MTQKSVLSFVLLLFGAMLLGSCNPSPQVPSLAAPTVSPTVGPLQLGSATPVPPPTRKPAITPSPSQQIESLPEGLLNGDSFTPGISADGRFVVYASYASNLVPDDLNGQPDIFLYDRSLKETLLISRGEDGSPAKGSSLHPVISPNGDWIAFSSDAPDLVSIEKTWEWGIFLYNRQDSTLSLGSLASDGSPSEGWNSWPSLSADGRYLAFVSTAENLAPSADLDRADVYLHDRQTGQTEVISLGAGGAPANGFSDKPVLSFDGRFVAFWSWASNLFPGETEFCMDPENPGPCADIYLYDREAQELERIPIGQSAGLGNGGDEISLTSDGRYLAYYDSVYDRQTRMEAAICEPIEAPHCGYSPSLSSTGRWVAYGTASSGRQVWVLDRQTGQQTQASLSPEGQPANGDAGLVFFNEGFFGSLVLSPDGRLVVYASQATNLVAEDLGICEDFLTFSGPRPCYAVFLFDRQSGATELISLPNTSRE